MNGPKLVMSAVWCAPIEPELSITNRKSILLQPSSGSGMPSSAGPRSKTPPGPSSSSPADVSSATVAAPSPSPASPVTPPSEPSVAGTDPVMNGSLPRGSPQESPTAAAGSKAHLPRLRRTPRARGRPRPNRVFFRDGCMPQGALGSHVPRGHLAFGGRRDGGSGDAGELGRRGRDRNAAARGRCPGGASVAGSDASGSARAPSQPAHGEGLRRLGASLHPLSRQAPSRADGRAGGGGVSVVAGERGRGRRVHAKPGAGGDPVPVSRRARSGAAVDR